MRVWLHLSVLDEPAHFDQLDAIARLLGTGCHRWVIDEAELEIIEACAWLTSEPDSRAGRRNRELFEKTAKLAIEQRGAELREAGIDPPPRAHQLRVAVGGPRGLELSEALLRLERPAYLLVEDDESDLRFLRCLTRAFDRDELATALEVGWLEVRHCGGKGGIRKRAERLLGAPGVVPERVRALLDSDRCYPGHESPTLDLAKRIKELGVGVHVLHKREAENYLPLAALAIARQARAYRAFRDRLSAVQQDYFDMKDGFEEERSEDARGRPRVEPKVSKEQSSLFGNVPKGVLSSLVGGFGKYCGRLFDRPEITREGLEARCRHHEAGSETELLDLLVALEMTL